jgi:hypothetical protein
MILAEKTLQVRILTFLSFWIIKACAVILEKYSRLKGGNRLAPSIVVGSGQ